MEFSHFLGDLLCPANWSLDLKYGEIQVWVLFWFWRGRLAALVGGVVLVRLGSPVEQLLASVPAPPFPGLQHLIL